MMPLFVFLKNQTKIRIWSHHGVVYEIQNDLHKHTISRNLILFFLLIIFSLSLSSTPHNDQSHTDFSIEFTYSSLDIPVNSHTFINIDDTHQKIQLFKKEFKLKKDNHKGYDKKTNKLIFLNSLINNHNLYYTNRIISTIYGIPLTSRKAFVGTENRFI